MQQKAHIFIASPIYTGSPTMDYASSALQTTVLLPQRGIRLMFHMVAGDGLIQRARAACVNAFMTDVCNAKDEASKPSHLLFIDSDIGWDPQDIERMVDADKDVVCGVYQKRQKELQFPCHFLKVEGNVVTGGCMEIKYAPTGFMMIRRNVIEKMIAAYPERRCMLNEGGWFSPGNYFGYDFFPTPMDLDGYLISEDYGFCKLWREIGGTVWVMPDIRLRHCGPYSFDGCIADFLKVAA